MASEYQNRPRIYCPDGFSISIQAGTSHYSSPHVDALPLSAYRALELGYPMQDDKRVILEELREYRDGYSDIYGEVEKEKVLALLRSHGFNGLPDMLPKRIGEDY